MSLILDALRKSEAERRRGQVPDLHAELPPLVRVAAAPRRRWPAWFAGVAALLAIGALGWSLWASRPPLPADPIATNGRVDAPAPPPRIPSSVDASERPAMPRDAVALPAPPESRRAVADDVRPSIAEPAPTVPGPPAAAPAAPPAPDTPVAAPEAARYAGAIASATPAPAPPAPIPDAPPLPSTGDTVRLADLSPGEREQLPALKISMHMWGPTPAQRFAIIDGTRVGQGDRVGEAVVEEIAADGVVLNWHGRRVALPLR